MVSACSHVRTLHPTLHLARNPPPVADHPLRSDRRQAFRVLPRHRTKVQAMATDRGLARHLFRELQIVEYAVLYITPGSRSPSVMTSTIFTATIFPEPHRAEGGVTGGSAGSESAARRCCPRDKT
jgi:hypothetical protein